MRPVIIDTDPGIDDAAAIWLALASHTLDVRAITTVFGNVPVGQASSNASAIVGLTNVSGVEIAAGADRPMVGAPRFFRDIHGEDGLGNIGLEAPFQPAPGAVQALLDHSTKSSKPTILALGPLTNIAHAILRDPGFATRVESIVVMGGAVSVQGNVTPAASANIFSDPEAADIVYGSGGRIVQVGLDVCNEALISGALLRQIRAAGGPIGEALWQLCSRHWSLRPGARLSDENMLNLNDPVSVAFLLMPSIFTTVNVDIRIETTGVLTRGATVADFAGRWGGIPHVHLCTDIDAAAYAELFARVLSGADDGRAA